jgi:LysR family transcriptional activator of glutamate synthase operon
VSLSDVANEPFISLKPGYDLREMPDAVMRQAGLNFRFVFEGDNLAVIPNLIRAGLGIGFVPAITWSTAMESFRRS